MSETTADMSRKWFWYFAVAFLAVFTFVILDQYVLNDIIDGVRRGSNGPEMLFQGEQSLWVPTSWAQYWWHQAKPLIFVPFVLLGLAIAYWHNWEEGQARE